MAWKQARRPRPTCLIEGKKATIMTISSKISLIPRGAIQGWQDFRREGEGFLKTATAAYTKRPEVFTAEILYNLVAMAIEKLVMAALMRYGTLPYNHTMADLVEAMEQTFPGAIQGLRAGLLQLDKYQQICDLDTYRITPPGRREIPAMLDLGARMQELVAEKIMAGAARPEAT